MNIAPFYGQRMEDKTIVELLGGESEHGFFVDAGAWEPDFESVSRHFYEMSWDGISIEPNPYYFSLLARKRPRDINLPIALSDDIGAMEMTLVEGSGLSTFDRECGERAAKKFPSRKIPVPVFTLRWVFENFLPVGKEIDWLKIDCENWEKYVICGNNWELYRPKVVCIEATIPATEIPNHEDWERFILGSRYEFAKTDGLNRFYVRDDSRTWGLTYPLQSSNDVSAILLETSNAARAGLGISVVP